MLDEVILRLNETAALRKRGSIIAERTKLSERRVRDGLDNLHPRTLERAKKNAIDYMRVLLVEKGLNEDEVEEWLKNQPGSFTAAAIYDAQGLGGDEYPTSLHFASRIDDLGNRFRKAHALDDVDQAKDVLINTDWLTANYFTSGSSEKSSCESPPFWCLASSAKDWEDLRWPVHAVRMNLLFALLSKLDVELASQNFRPLEPQSIFELVFPYDTKRGRSRFKLPVHRLLDFMAALSFIHLHEQFPEEPFKLKELVEICKEDEPNIRKWRTGKKRFGWSNFENIWLTLFPRHEVDGVSGRAWPINPLYIAAIIFQNEFTRIDTVADRVQQVATDVEDYHYWWRIEMEEAEKTRGVTFGDIPWPKWLIKP